MLSRTALFAVGLTLCAAGVAGENDQPLQDGVDDLGRAIRKEVSAEVGSAARRFGLLRGQVSLSEKRAKVLVQKDEHTFVAHHRGLSREKTVETRHGGTIATSSLEETLSQLNQANAASAAAHAQSQLNTARRALGRIVSANDQLQKDLSLDNQRTDKLEEELKKQSSKVDATDAANRAMDAVMAGYETQQSQKAAKAVVKAYHDPAQDMMKTAEEKEQSLKDGIGLIQKKKLSDDEKAAEMEKQRSEAVREQEQASAVMAKARAENHAQEGQLKELEQKVSSANNQVQSLGGAEEQIKEENLALNAAMKEVSETKKAGEQTMAKVKTLSGSLLQEEQRAGAARKAKARAVQTARKRSMLVAQISDLQTELKGTQAEAAHQDELTREFRAKGNELEAAAAKQEEQLFGVKKEEERWKTQSDALALQVADLQKRIDRAKEQTDADAEKARDDDAGMDTYFDEDASMSEKVQVLQNQVEASYAAGNKTEDTAKALRTMVAEKQSKLDRKRAQTHAVWVQAEKAIAELKFRVGLDHAAEREQRLTLGQIEAVLTDGQRQALGLAPRVAPAAKKAGLAQQAGPAPGLDRLFHPERYAKQR